MLFDGARRFVSRLRLGVGKNHVTGSTAAHPTRHLSALGGPSHAGGKYDFEVSEHEFLRRKRTG